MLGGAVGALLYNNLLSVDAMSGEICHLCCREKSRGHRALTPTFDEEKSRGQITLNSANEKYPMLSTET